MEKLRHWLTALIAPLGPWGIFIVSFLDSSVLTFPVINELLVINYSIRNPDGWAFYGLMATLGSVLGSCLLFFLARKGGEAFFRKRAGKRAEQVRGWLEHNGFVSVLLAALLPPPAPFKIAVIGSGAFNVRLRDFALAVLIARSVRYLGEAYLAAHYGERTMHIMTEHKLEAALISVGAVLVLYLATRLLLRLLHRGTKTS